MAALTEPDFLEDPPDDLQCPICLAVLKEPHLIPCCGQHFCRQCTARLRHKPCPMCKTTPLESVEDKSVQRRINRLRVRCPGKGEGCAWVGELGELARHFTNCEFGGRECGFSFAGCSARGSRNKMAEHMKECVEAHLGMLSEAFKTVSAELSEARSEIQRLEKQLKSFIPPPDVVFSDFSKHKEAADNWYSPPFYSHIGGYKMTLRVNANGVVNGEGTHVSVFLHLLRGDYDDGLSWPFRGEATIQLVNQRREGGHLSTTVRFDDNTPNDVASRVIEGERATTGRGRNQFVAHSLLGYNEHTNTEYLKNDCLKIRIVRIRPF